MNTTNKVDFNIPSPEPFIAGTYKQVIFDITDSTTGLPYNLTTSNDIIFSMCPFGRSDSTLNLFLSKNSETKPRIIIDPDKTNRYDRLLINLYSVDTATFINSDYILQITCTSSDGYTDVILGKGIISVRENIRF